MNKNVDPAFKVEVNNNNRIIFSTTTDYDNDKDRFTLLTVTFLEKDANENVYKYNVFVPILVRRMLEMDFTATLTYGTDFRSDDYNSSLANHVLESFGSSITGYLTYTYNSAEEVYVDYGWQSYIDAGGNLMDMKKSIKFAMARTMKFPQGSQLTLIDATSGRAYYYSATGNEAYEDEGFVIPLSDFVNSDGKHYQEPSISELIGAEVKPGGKFVKVDANGIPEGATAVDGKTYNKPTVRIKQGDTYEYYRLAQLDESGNFSITVNEESLKKEDTTTKKITSEITENYYLVITVPESKDTSSLNGSIQTKVESSIPHQIHYRKLAGATEKDRIDSHSGTASTYQLSNGYQQVLEETDHDGLAKKITIDDSMMKVDLTDKISFPKDQIYETTDQLYLRFVSGLLKTLGSENGKTSSEAFPSGTTGEASFYVYTKEGESKKYYEYKDGSWTKGDKTEPIIAKYRWTSTGENMELLLSTDGTIDKAISLQGLRDDIKKNNSTDSTLEFYVEVKLQASIPGTGLDVIPESKVDNNIPKDFVKMTYFSQISTVKENLSYSTNRASASGTTAYYRDEAAGASLTYDADKVDQLGINLLDLQNEYLEDGARTNSYIATNATYMLSSVKDITDTLKNSDSIKFTLQLMPKKNKDETDNENWREEYGGAIKDADQYLGVTLNSKDSTDISYAKETGTWTWKVSKNKYYDSMNGTINSGYLSADGKFKLTQSILLKVNVANVENAGHFYSNYKVVLTAEVLDNNKNSVSATRRDSNIIYTLAKINPTKFILPTDE